MTQVQPPTYDIIIFGSSGFTGKYVVRETLKFLNTPNSLLKTLASAGRNPSKLTEALKWANPSHVNILIIAADISDPLSLKHMASNAKIILNCVGPFHVYGENVVSACVDCDYLDICGEPEFLEKMEAGFYDKVVENGRLLVFACGFDYVHAELGLMFNSRQCISPAVPNQFEAYLNLEYDKNMSLNYATLESALLWMANADNLVEFRRSRPYKACFFNQAANIPNKLAPTIVIVVDHCRANERLMALNGSKSGKP